MAVTVRVALALGALLGTAVVPVCGQENLVVPPDFRAAAAPPIARPVPTRRKGQSAKRKHAPALKTKAASKGVGHSAEPAATRPRTLPDDALSLGMKWNASNAPNNGADSLTGLVGQYNKNLNGQDVGSGAQVGLKYKF